MAREYKIDGQNVILHAWSCVCSFERSMEKRDGLIQTECCWCGSLLQIPKPTMRFLYIPQFLPAPDQTRLMRSLEQDNPHVVGRWDEEINPVINTAFRSNCPHCDKGLAIYLMQLNDVSQKFFQLSVGLLNQGVRAEDSIVVLAVPETHPEFESVLILSGFKLLAPARPCPHA